jgi:ribosome-dependent ATPase
MQARSSRWARRRRWRSAAAKLEDAFVAYLEDAARGGAATPQERAAEPLAPAKPEVESRSAVRGFDWGRLWAYARRETMEILRDPAFLLAQAVRSP